MDDADTRRVSEPPRFVLTGALLDAQTAKLTGADLHHARRVLRLVPGAAVILIDGTGGEYRARIREFQRDFAFVEILSRRQNPRLARRTLGVAMIKGWRMDFLVEKAAELGATELYPLRCARSVVAEAGSERVERWRRIAAAAAKQCLSPFIMEIKSVCPFERFLSRARDAEFAAICCRGAPPLGLLARRRAWTTAAVACGPEGNFTDQELESAVRAGLASAGVGPYRLRTETAALAALGVLADAADAPDVFGDHP